METATPMMTATSTLPSSVVSRRPTTRVSPSSTPSFQATTLDALPTFTVCSLTSRYYDARLTCSCLVLTHSLNETTVNANNTLEALYTAHSAHVGQIFFDQDLISTVEETSPYSTNTQELTTNDEDSILAEEADTIDPFVEYVFLGDSVSDGIFAWISLAMDSSESSSVTPAAYYTEEGGVENENSGGGAGGPGGSGPGGPGGAPPS